MKKLFYFFCFLLILGFMVLGLNLKVTTRYGVDYVQYEKKIPLYLKALRFVSRDLEMRFLVQDIIKDKIASKEKIETLFQWVIQNIQLHPPNMPVIDDHPWSIIVRGYGDADQLDDVFSLMAMHAGFKACYDVMTDPVKRNRYPLAFVFYDGQWWTFDLRKKIYFVGNQKIDDECMRRNLSQFPLKRLWFELKHDAAN